MMNQRLTTNHNNQTTHILGQSPFAIDWLIVTYTQQNENQRSEFSMGIGTRVVLYRKSSVIVPPLSTNGSKRGHDREW